MFNVINTHIHREGLDAYVASTTSFVSKIDFDFYILYTYYIYLISVNELYIFLYVHFSRVQHAQFFFRAVPTGESSAP